jgi:Zn-dependent protease with chaperone function
MTVKQKLLIALTAYVVLAVLAWQTLNEERIRLFVLVILAFFAFKTVLYWRRQEQEKRSGM